MMLLSAACFAILGKKNMDTAAQHKPASGHAASQSVADSINAFAFKLIEKTGTPSSKNVLISPFSVTTAMSMVVPGLVGKDQHTLMIALAPGLTLDQLEAGNSGLSHSMLAATGQPLQIANSAWLNASMKANPAFGPRLQHSYHAEIHTFNPDEASVKKMNSWVDAKTKHRIDKIIDRLTPDNRLVLINAIAFDGKWQHQFDPKRTRVQDFHKLDGSVTKAPMMHMKEEIGYAQTESLSAIRLDYQGKDFSMIVMLPEKGRDAGALLRSMSPTSLSSLLGKLQKDEVPVTLPRFKFSDSYELGDPLSKLGMASLFELANFSGVSPELSRGHIDRVIHKTFIDVDEKGTKAAAATAVVVTRALRANTPEFVADRPFAFLILHNATKAILFAGVVNDPK